MCAFACLLASPVDSAELERQPSRCHLRSKKRAQEEKAQAKAIERC